MSEAKEGAFYQLMSEFVVGFKDDLTQVDKRLGGLEERVTDMERVMAVNQAVHAVYDISALIKRVESLEKWRYGIVLVATLLGGSFAFLTKLPS